MKNWEIFETEVAEWIRNSVGNNIKIEQKGTSDSTESDILVSTNKGKYYIETKMNKAQTSQFALTIENGKFVYSDNNRYQANKYSNAIIDELNSNPDYLKAGTKGLEINISDELATNWIISNMKNKGVRFVATKSNGQKKIFKLEDFGKAFDIKAKIRIKKSGSSPLPRKDFDSFISVLRDEFPEYEIIYDNNRPFVKLDKDFGRYELKNCRFCLSNKGNGVFEPRKLSATANNTVIFQISAKKDSVSEDLESCFAF